jgi:hypothetical protein
MVVRPGPRREAQGDRKRYVSRDKIEHWTKKHKGAARGGTPWKDLHATPTRGQPGAQCRVERFAMARARDHERTHDAKLAGA